MNRCRSSKGLLLCLAVGLLTASTPVSATPLKETVAGLRAKAVGSFRALMTRVQSRGAAAPAPVEEKGRRVSYERKVTRQVLMRGIPGARDKVRSTIVETWRESRVQHSPMVVSAPSFDWSSRSFRIGMDRDKVKALEMRDGVWTAVTRVSSHLSSSTPTLRKAAAPMLDLILRGASAGVFEDHDTRPTMVAQVDGMTLTLSTENKSGVLTLSLNGQRDRWLPLGKIELDTNAGVLKITSGDGTLALQETRSGDGRASIERTSYKTHALRPSKTQTRLDAAFVRPE